MNGLYTFYSNNSLFTQTFSFYIAIWVALSTQQGLLLKLCHEKGFLGPLEILYFIWLSDGSLYFQNKCKCINQSYVMQLKKMIALEGETLSYNQRNIISACACMQTGQHLCMLKY